MNSGREPDHSPVTFNPIGWVESEFPGYAPSDEMRERPSRIVLRPESSAGEHDGGEGKEGCEQDAPPPEDPAPSPDPRTGGPPGGPQWTHGPLRLDGRFG